MHPRGVRALPKPHSSPQTIAIQPFVTGLATDLVAFANLRHRPQSGSLIRDEANSFVHCTALSPRHRLILPADRELSPIHPVYSVTHLSGLDMRSDLSHKGRGGRTCGSIPISLIR